MKEEKNYRIGILAYGSLIDNPGKQIKDCEIDRIECKTPFNVEFARISNSRNNAPTLIPVDNGNTVIAQIIVLKEEVSLEDAKSILYRRETHRKENENSRYIEPDKPTSRNVLIGELDNFMNVEKVIYTYFLIQEEYKELTPEKLADYAVDSIKSEAGKNGKDGIRYLLAAKENGIKTEKSEAYEQAILRITNSNSLIEVIEKFHNQ